MPRLSRGLPGDTASRDLLTSGLLLAVWGLASVAQADGTRGPLVPAASAPRSCTLANTNIAGAVTLESDCDYAGQTVVINQSNTTLDCNGARLTGGTGHSIIVTGDIENVTVKNCYLEGAGLLVSPPPRRDGETDDQLRSRSPRNVVITNVSVESTPNAAVFFGPCAAGPVLQDSIVENAGSTGVYLEYGTQQAVVRNNLIKNNGLYEGQIERTDWTRREGVAVDASAYNTIEGNDFEGNAFGGVFLYKNCWENHSTDPNSRQRLQHAHSNIIRDNTFTAMPFGVWVASRQARDLATWDCGDDTPYQNPLLLSDAFPPDYPTYRSTYPAPYDFNIECFSNALQGLPCLGGCSTDRTGIYVWPDFAEDNVIDSNRFENLSLAGVRVEDDGTQLLSNHFVGDFDFIYVGTPFRSRYLKHPVLDTVMSNNTYEAANPATTRFYDQVVLVPGEHQGTQLGAGASCQLPWGGTLPSAGQVQAYEAPKAGSCRSEWRTCADGTLTGSFPNATCGQPKGTGGRGSGCRAAGGEDGLWLLVAAWLGASAPQSRRRRAAGV